MTAESTVKFVKNKVGENTLLTINHSRFSAQLSLYGAQLLSFVPTDNKDRLWLSDTAVLDGSKPIRGGVPICWPWFGPSVEKGLPQHGYARTAHWQITETTENNESVCLTLTPVDSSAILKLPLQLTVRITLSDTAQIELITTNKSNEPQPLSQAIHSYFYCPSIIEQTKLVGLENTEYADKLTNETKQQLGSVTINTSADRVYLSRTSQLELQGQGDKLVISGENHDSVVVWNPWLGAKDMADFDDEGYKHMLCVEMANTQGLTIAPEQSFTLVQRF